MLNPILFNFLLSSYRKSARMSDYTRMGEHTRKQVAVDVFFGYHIIRSSCLFIQNTKTQHISHHGKSNVSETFLRLCTCTFHSCWAIVKRSLWSAPAPLTCPLPSRRARDPGWTRDMRWFYSGVMQRSCLHRLLSRYCQKVDDLRHCGVIDTTWLPTH